MEKKPLNECVKKLNLDFFSVESRLFIPGFRSRLSYPIFIPGFSNKTLTIKAKMKTLSAIIKPIKKQLSRNIDFFVLFYCKYRMTSNQNQMRYMTCELEDSEKNCNAKKKKKIFSMENHGGTTLKGFFLSSMIFTRTKFS